MFADLINSPKVYYQPDVTTDLLASVIVTSSNQVLTDSDGMIQANITFKLSQGHITHIG